MIGQSQLDSRSARRYWRAAAWNRILTAALVASLWFAAIRFVGPWCGLVVSLVPIYFVRQLSWRHGLLVVTLLVHLAWQIVWMV
jgi:uncharacterized membrane protein YgaE (UPF0421/DUF939 family)